MSRVAIAAAGAMAVVATTVAVAPPSVAQTYWVPASGRVVISGHGFGHGHGMSQYGAEGAGRAGKSWQQILGFYYPGTHLDRAGGALRVLLTVDSSSDVVVNPTAGLGVRDRADGKRWLLPTKRVNADRWRITPTKDKASKSSVQYLKNKRWHRWKIPGRTLLRGDGQFSAKGPIGLVLPGGTVRRYRGVLRSASAFAAATVRDTVNVVSMDQYVRGVLPAEMPTSWTMAALRSQAVAARTYAAWSRQEAGDRYWQVCDTTSCQVYGGLNAEAPRGNEAVASTANRILRYQGEPAFTQFSASSGGWTSAGGPPYLPAKKDPWDDWAGNSYHDWRRTVEVGFFEDRYPELGRLRSIKVTKREGHGEWGGRAVQVVLGGSQGSVQLSGDDLRWALGLPSTWFKPRLTPIQRQWERLGGAKSPYGWAAAREQRVKSKAGLTGVMQRFDHGRMYWSRRSQAHGLYGRVLASYREQGGLRSSLGYPTSHTTKTGDKPGRRAFFQRGLVIWSPSTGARTLRGKILKAYGRHHYAAGPLGFPTTNIFPVEAGRRAKFRHGSITWLRKTDNVDVHIRS